MLDVKFIKENLEEVKQGLLKRMSPDKLNLEEIIKLDDERRDLIS